ncbi:hypothetical protein MTO96_002773 [Rhipicephalus appendiculatus]
MKKKGAVASPSSRGARTNDVLGEKRRRAEEQRGPIKLISTTATHPQPPSTTCELVELLLPPHDEVRSVRFSIKSIEAAYTCTCGFRSCGERATDSRRCVCGGGRERLLRLPPK